MEKVKAFFAKYKWLAVGLLAVVFVVIYKLFFAKSSDESAGVAMQSFTPAPSTGGGAAGTDNTSQALSAIKDVISDSSKAQADAAKAQQENQTSFLTGMVSTISGFMGSIKDTLTAQNKSTSDVLKSMSASNTDFKNYVKDIMADSQESVNNALDMIKTKAVMPDVPSFDSFEPTTVLKRMETPTTTTIGKERIVGTGVYKPPTYTRTDKFGKKVVGANIGNADAVTNIEYETVGMNASQKIAYLKSKGLAS